MSSQLDCYCTTSTVCGARCFEIRGDEMVLELAAVRAMREGESISQLVTTALAEKPSVLLTEEYPEAGARRGRREKFEEALSEVRDRESDPGDELERGPHACD